MYYFKQVRNNKQALKSVSETLTNEYKSLLGIDQKQEQCLKQFLKSKKLVKWLQQSLKGLFCLKSRLF